MTARLVLHRGAHPATRDEVARVVTPDRTRTWVPIPHATLLDGVQAALERVGLTVTAESHGLGHGGDRLFSLLRLADAQRPLSDPSEIQRAALRVLGEHLEVDRVLYAEVAQAGQAIVIRDCYMHNGVQKWTGSVPLAALAELEEQVRRGETAVVADINSSVALSERSHDPRRLRCHPRQTYQTVAC